MQYAIRKSINRLEITLRLENTTGGVAAAIIAGRSPRGSVPLEVGDHQVDVVIGPQLLVPGDYLITAWLHDPMLELFDFQEKILTLKITNSSCDFASLGTASLLGAILIDPDALIPVEAKKVIGNEKHG